MKLQGRAYCAPSDLATMRALLLAGTQSGIAASYPHPGLLDWATHYPPDETANRQNLRLWEAVDTEPPTLVAWALFFDHEGTFDLFVHPTIYDTPLQATVVADYVAWAEARARAAGLAHLSPFWMYDYDKVMARLLEAHGFHAVQADPPAPLFARPLTALPTVPLPAGFTIQGVKTQHDGQLRAQVTHGAFQPQADWGRYWADYAQFIGSSVYDGDRDLFVRSPDGRGAAACTIWFDEVNRVGLFEPVATHPDFQRQGLGKAVMAEGLRRMAAAGMKQAVLGFDPNNRAALALYTAMGFQTACYFALYSKPIQ